MTFGVRMRSGEGRWSGRPRFIKRGTGTSYRKLQSLKFFLTRDRRAVARFLTTSMPLSIPARIDLLRRFTHITNEVRGYHTLVEMLTVSEAILRRTRPVVVEAGTGTGSSTAKLSLATQLANGHLYGFDSFTGIPDNDEDLHLLDGRPLRFNKGAFKGRLTAVQKRIETFGAPEVVTLTKGLFEDTLPGFARTADVILLDVDLASSTRTCVEHLFPHLAQDGILFSQDGHIRETLELFEDAAFWRSLGEVAPRITRHGDGKLLSLTRG